MKKINLIMFGVLVLILAACVAVPAVNPPTLIGQSLVALPPEGQTLIWSLVTAGVAFLLLKINMGQYQQAIVAILAPIIVTAVETLLGTIPPVFDNLILSLIHLAVLFVAGSLGTFVFFKRAKTPQIIMTG